MFYAIFPSDIPDLDTGDLSDDPLITTYAVRRAARGILLDPETGRIALLHVTRRGYHKLPWGGIETRSDGTLETYEEAFTREIHEETGCESIITHTLGTVIEYREYMTRLQISRAYMARLVGAVWVPHLTHEERDKGFELVWMPIDTAIAQLESDRPQKQGEKFIRLRDLAILREARSLLTL